MAATESDVEVDARKDQLRAAARAIDPLKPLREHPYLTVGAAAALGVMAGSSELSKSVKNAVSSGGLRMLFNAMQHLGRGWMAAAVAEQQGQPVQSENPQPPTG
jgi:uncharacterized protein YidB (DUF937 family)